jgi:hypothetical protein
MEQLMKVEWYQRMYRILDTCWEKKRSVHLGNLLSDMYGLYHDNGEFLSFDQAIFEDYSKLWDEKIGADESATAEQAYAVFKESVIDYYKSVPEYEIGYAEDYLREQLFGEAEK